MSSNIRRKSSRNAKNLKLETPEFHDVMAKDSFLKNSELKAMTFSYLKNDVKMKRQFFLNAALSCKDFLHVALDALWEELDSLVPLLEVLPSLQLDNKAYVCVHAHIFYMTLFCL